MFRCSSQNLAHFTALCIPRANTVATAGKRDITITPKVDDEFGFSGETMNVPRLMVLRINDKQNVFETARRHKQNYNQSRLG